MRPSVASLRKLPLGMLGAIPLMLLVEMFIARYDVHLMTPDQWIMRRTVEHARRDAPDRDVLVFGDSLAKLSLAPRQVEAETGLRGWNLAVSGSQASNSYYMLKRALEAGARPKFVLVDFFPPLQRLPLRHVVENDPYQLSWGETLEVAVRARDLDFLGTMLARMALPSFRQREAVRTVVKAHILKTFERRWAVFSHPLMLNHRNNDGAQIHPTGEPDVAAVARLDSGYFPRWEVAPIQEQYMDKFFDLAESRGAVVVWIIPPYLTELYQRTVRSGFDAEWTRYIDTKLASRPNLRVFDARRSVHPTASFMDPNHLSRNGASVFSRDVGRYLAAIHDGDAAPRHLVLEGPASPLVGADRLEDLAESGRVVRRTAQSRAPAPSGIRR